MNPRPPTLRRGRGLRYLLRRSCSNPSACPAQECGKQKARCSLQSTGLWWARVDSRAAHLKKPRRGFFARRQSGGPVLFESTHLPGVGARQTKSPMLLAEHRALVGAGGFASRAPEKAPQGLFRPPAERRAGAVRIRPRDISKANTYKKAPAYFYTSAFGGRGWIRTTEAEKQQIYSLSPLATREHALILFRQADCSTERLIIITDSHEKCNSFFQNFFASLRPARSRPKAAARIHSEPPATRIPPASA